MTQPKTRIPVHGVTDRVEIDAVAILISRIHPLLRSSRMKAYVGLDVSQRETSICIVDLRGDVVEEFTAPSNPQALGETLLDRGHRYVRVGLESCGIADWLYEGLAEKGLPIICIEARHAHGVLKARVNKTDRNDARGIAAIMHAGFYRAVHIKSAPSRKIRTLLATRRLLRLKIVDIENGIAGLLSTSGRTIARARGRRFYETQVFSLAESEPDLLGWLAPLLAARAALQTQFTLVDEAVKQLAGEDPICRRLMTAPGVGPLVAITYRVAIDIPTRFSRSRNVGAHLGLAPRTRQSGTLDLRGRISRCGDRQLRSALYLAATAVLNPRTGPSPLRAWGQSIAERRGRNKAKIAVARRLAVILHRMWVNGTDYDNGATVA